MTTSRHVVAWLALLACLVVPFSADAFVDTQAALEDRIRTFASLVDRSTGTPGAAGAADFIESELSDIFSGQDVSIDRHGFLLPIPGNVSGTLVHAATGTTVPLTPLLMNSLSSGAIPDPGHQGTAYYVGHGDLADFNGLTVSGSVILMDLDSGKNWQNAAMLGARALIFVDHSSDNLNTPRRLFEDKLEMTPIDFPAFWMDAAQATEVFGDLREFKVSGRGQDVTLSCSLRWERARGDNIYCLVPGSDPDLAGELVVIEAFYDSTALVPGRSPGADEAASIASMLELARDLAASPPAYPVLLLATAGHSQYAAGMREFAWALTVDQDDLADLLAHYEDRVGTAASTLEVLRQSDPLAMYPEPDTPEGELLRNALQAVLKAEIEKVSQKLIELRLLNAPDDAAIAGRIEELASTRLEYRRIALSSSPVHLTEGLTPRQQDILRSMLPNAQILQSRIHTDASEQLSCLESVAGLRGVVGDRHMAASLSLHLSSRGLGLGAFERGWLYDLSQDVNRTRFLSSIDDVFRSTARSIDHGGLFFDTLNLNQMRPWESYLPDRPVFDSEPLLLGGFPAITLATVEDARILWGTPHDSPERVDIAFLAHQHELLATLVRGIVNHPLPEADSPPKNRIANIHARVNLMRQGEIFPDWPATGSIFLCFQGNSRLYGWVDTEGIMRIHGLANQKVTEHKAVLEGFRFDEQTGRAVWAVDKRLTGKDAYRIKLKKEVTEIDLILFPCEQTTLFSTLEPRTYRYMFVPSVFDARTEAEPIRMWYSRLDTWSSSLGSFFFEPNMPFKVAFSDNFLGQKVVILNTDEDNTMGKGFRPAEWPVIPLTEQIAARDMWRLIGPRIDTLEEHGIVNDKIRSFSHGGRSALAMANDYLSDNMYDKGLEAARTSLSMASYVYNEVLSTQKDVLAGVLFYIALFVPFAFSMERLLFGFTSINKRIGAFLGILVVLIAVIYAVHPAFQLTYSPLVVILAFFILGLSFIVALIIFFRFEREMSNLQRAAMHTKPTSISRTGAFSAAFSLGVSNLRRRPLRTTLTCITLIILTFTIMNFTVVKNVREQGWTRFSDQAGYTGVMMKYVNWQDMPVEALQVMENKYRELGSIAPRVWYQTSDPTRSPIITARTGGQEHSFRGMIGLSHTEPRVTGIDKSLASGRWFREDERRAAIISEPAAQALGISLDDPDRSTIRIWGMDLSVVGILRQGALDRTPDLDGEPMTPIFYPNATASEQAFLESLDIKSSKDAIGYQSRYQHVSGDDVIIVPATTLLSMNGMTGLKAVATDVPASDNGGLPGSLGDRFGMLLFKGDASGSHLFYATDSFSYSGMSNILIPLFISMLIVLNTMIGSVYERKGEIAVYTSVGLAPSHVAFLFIAEALALAVISVVLGYLLAQGAAALLAGTGFWQGMTANYSSMAGVGAMLLVIGVVLVSVIYPAKVAASIAIPDVNKSWTMPEAKGDVIEAVLPFLIKNDEQAYVGGFLLEYYEGHRDVSHGLFSSDDIASSFRRDEDLETSIPVVAPTFLSESQDVCLTMDLRVWLAPFDFGVRQKVRLIFCPSDSFPGYRQIKLHVTREAGELVVWKNLNKYFFNDLRKKLLSWRSLQEDTRVAFEHDLFNKVDNPRPEQEPLA